MLVRRGCWKVSAIVSHCYCSCRLLRRVSFVKRFYSIFNNPSSVVAGNVGAIAGGIVVSIILVSIVLVVIVAIVIVVARRKQKQRQEM